MSSTGCAGWKVQDLGSAEAYIEYIEKHGAIYCEVHQCDAWMCFSDSTLDQEPAKETTEK